MPSPTPAAPETPSAGFLRTPAPVELAGWGLRLLPLSPGHALGLEHACADGELWKLRVTSAPSPGQAGAYIAQALDGQREGHMLPFVVTDAASGDILGTTRYHDIAPAVARLEIGYTWYARRCQRTHVNTACKLLLLTHAFEALGARTVGWRTDVLNTTSQRAIERLGARQDGILRGHALRRDGTVRDTVMYSLTRDEWPATRDRLTQGLQAGAAQHSNGSANQALP